MIVVLTGGQLLNHNKTLNEYVHDRKDSASLFVAADTDAKSDIEGTPDQFDSADAAYVVFYNIEDTEGRDELGKKTRELNYVSRLWNGDDHNPCAILANCINDNALKDWSAGACSGQSSGTLSRLNPEGWLPKQQESKSHFVCPANTVMTGRWHDCKNKGEKCDENGDSTVYCTNVSVLGVPLAVAAGSWSAGIKESAGLSYLCPVNTVMTGRRHDCKNKGDKCDENGDTEYLCSTVSLEGKELPADPNGGFWSTEIVESMSQFVCPDNTILNGRHHKGDENGKTKYHCIPVPAPGPSARQKGR